MIVTVEYYGALGKRLGRRRVELQIPEPCSVAALLHILCTNYPDLGTILAMTHGAGPGMTPCVFAVNGRFVPANRAEGTLLHNGDRVTLMLLPAGG